MINLGLSHADHSAFEATLRQSHLVRTTAHIHDRNERIIYTFDGTIVSGSVQVDITQSGDRPKVKDDAWTSASGPVRTLDLTVLRPGREPMWLPDSGQHDAVFANNFISVKYGVFVEWLSDGPGWVDVPVFWGPITGIDQDGEQFTIKAAGKEVLALDPCLLWQTLNLRKGTGRLWAIRDILTQNGETRFHMCESNNRLSRTWSLNRYTEPWKAAVSMARSGNFQIFYDGLGRVRVRPWPKNRVWNFNEGANGCLLSRPQISYDISNVRNTIEIIGGTPKGSKKQLVYRTSIDPGNPLSPDQLARNGQRRWMVHSEQTNITKQSDAWARAQDLLFQYMTTAMTVSFDSLVVPHLEEGDVVNLAYAGQHFEFMVANFTIPLGSGDSMSVGRNTRITWRKRGKRHDKITYMLGGA